MDYAKLADAAREKARDILRGQMAVRIQTRVQEAHDGVVKAIRHYAKLVTDFAEAEKKAAEDAAKRKDRRGAFSDAVTNVPGATVDELTLVNEALEADRKDADEERASSSESGAKMHAEALAVAAKAIEKAREARTHAMDNLAKLNAGELKVNAEELGTLAQKLIEEERAEA